MADDTALIIQLPAGSPVDRNLRADPPPSVTGGRTVVEPLPAGPQGTLEPPAAGQVVLSFLSPEDLRRESEQVSRELRQASAGQPPVVVIEVAEYLREDEVAVLLQAAERAQRTVLLCILGSTS